MDRFYLVLFRKESVLIFLVFFLAFAFRLYITPLAFHDDILSNAAWGEWVYKNGPDGFYENTKWIYSWPTQPPLINLVYGFNYYLYTQITWKLSYVAAVISSHNLLPDTFSWFLNFAKRFDMDFYDATPFKWGFLISMKLVAMIADIAIAVVIYILARKVNHSKALLWSVIFLFSPFSWYISGLWGQYDQISYLFLLISLLVLAKRYLFLALPLLVVSLSLKPTSLIFIPLFLWLYYKQKPTLKEIIIGIGLSAAIFFYSVSLFTSGNLSDFINSELVPKIFYKSEFRVSTNAFNFWHILIGNQALNQNSPFLFIPAKLWGYIAFLIFNLYALKISSRVTYENIFKSMFVIGAGSWLFLTNMLDRYFFAGVMSLLFLAISDIKLMKYWIPLSLIFWLNLYNQWWFPGNLNLLRQLLTWQDALITRFLALANVIIFLKITYGFGFLTRLEYFSFKGVKEKDND